MLDAALAAYGLTGAKAELLRHNENLTYRVDDRYLLRIHCSAPGLNPALLDAGASPLALRRQELDFLQYLHAQGMRVQQPVPNRQGEAVTLLPGGTSATLLTWLPGRTPGPEDATAQVFEAAGSMLARLHRLAARYPGEALRRYDAAFCRRLASLFAQSGLTPRHRQLLTGVCDRIALALSRTQDAFILLHGDLCSANLVMTPDSLAPIDFSLLGAGHPMFDLALLLCSSPPPGMAEEYAAGVLRGYLGGGGAVDEALLEHGTAMGILSCIALHLAAWPHEEWFSGAMDRWEKQTFRPLMERKPLFSPAVRAAMQIPTIKE